jgi:serine/threonine protein kinase
MFLVPPNPFTAKIKSSFLEGSDLLLEIEYPTCGCFDGSHLRRSIAELYVTVSKAHSEGIVLGDIQLENVMINADRHIMLADFGRRPFIIERRTFTAPEVIEKGHFSFTSDWFAMGMVLLTALTGQTLDGELPVWIDDDVRQLLSILLASDRKRRTDAELEKLPMFSGLDWKEVFEKRFLEVEDDGIFNEFEFGDLNDIPAVSKNLLISGFD